jgi:Tfp pilus assembly protein PilV
MRYWSQNKHRVSSQGFTLIEVLIIAPIVVLMVGGFVSLMVTMVGDVITTRDQSTLSYETQSALDRIEQDTRLSTQFLVTTGTLTTPQGSNNNFTGTSAFSSTSNQLIFNALTTDENPTSSSRWLIYYANQPNPCGGGQPHNRVLVSKVIYFINAGSLWRRTVMPPFNQNNPIDANTVCSAPWQKNSCSPGYSATLCKTNDEEIMKNVDTFTVKYFSAPNSTSELGAANALNASTIDVAIGGKKTIAGRDLTSTGTVRATKLNSTDTTQSPPSAPVVSHTLVNPNSVQFTWGAVSGATAYQISYRINNGEWINQSLSSSTTDFTIPGNRTEVVSFKVAAFNVTGLSAYSTDSETFPAWATYNLQGGWQDYASGYSPHAFTKTKENIIVLKGLIKSGPATWDSVIGTLPVGYRPAQRLIMFTNTYDAGANPSDSGDGRIDILPNGEIHFMNGTSTWIALDGITFVASDASYTWTNLTYQNGWTNYGSGWATARASKDVSTRVHLEGLAQQGTTAWGTAIAGLPAGYAPALHQRFATNGDNWTYNAFAAYSSGTLNTLGYSNAYLSLQAMYYPASYTNWTDLTLQNGWVAHAAGYASPQYTKSSDGIVTVKGLIKSGSTANGSIIANLPPGYRPAASQIFSSVANDAYGRIDVAANGDILFRVGHVNSTSLDAISFIADQ